MEYVLETNALTKRYRGSIALDGLTMRIPQGAIYGFVGRNGRGKTTLTALSAACQAPTSGSYTLYGAKYPDPRLARARRRMGAVVETPSIYLGMTAAENLRPAVPGAGPARQRVAFLIFSGWSAWRARASEINAQLQALRRFRPFPLTVSFNAHPLVLVTVFHIAVPPIPGVQYWGYHSKPAQRLFVFFYIVPAFFK